MNELNAKVAKILGWFISPGIGGPLWHRPGDARSWPEPQFDADPTLLPEMLAWLHERWGNVELHIGKSDTMAAVLVGDPVSGKTINEAVARLVVAVAEKKP